MRDYLSRTEAWEWIIAWLEAEGPLILEVTHPIQGLNSLLEAFLDEGIISTSTYRQMAVEASNLYFRVEPLGDIFYSTRPADIPILIHFIRRLAEEPNLQEGTTDG